ncbi:YcjF family protein [Meridianimarinicoccus aquatilis]|nr:DUF697 domain-containing protein [Fluviibacterium aquatile]
MAARPKTSTTPADSDETKGNKANSASASPAADMKAAHHDDGTVMITEETRQFRAERMVKEHIVASLGLGLIPVPLVDIATGLASNVMLVKRLCTLYDQPFKAAIARTAVLSIMGVLGSVGAAVTVGFSLAKLIPGIGTAAGTVTLPIANGATAYVIGKMFIGHFEMGGTLFDFDPRSNVPQVRSAYEEGRELAAELLASRRKTSDDTAAASADAAASTA